MRSDSKSSSGKAWKFKKTLVYFFTLATVYIPHSLDADDRLPQAEKQHAESQMR